MMQICDGYFQSSAPRELLKPNRRRSQHPENGRTNGYSIAEIMLVFGIIAGVLIGVWAMYTMLAGDTEAKTVVAEIQMLQQAITEYRVQGGGDVTTLTSIDPIKPYLGRGAGLKEGKNALGEDMYVSYDSGDRYKAVALRYEGIVSDEICQLALQRFGILRVNPYGGAAILPGNSLPGYKGADASRMGCSESKLVAGAHRLSILVK